MDRQQQQWRKKRSIRVVIVLCLLLIPLLWRVQQHLLFADSTLPISATVLIFALINLNGLLVLLVLYLVLRSLVELVFERRQNLLGSKLRTKLVISFVSLSLVPTVLLFMVALRFISTSMDYWFNTNVESSLSASLSLARETLKEQEIRAVAIGEKAAFLLAQVGSHWSKEEVNQFFSEELSQPLALAADGFMLISTTLEVVVHEQGARLVGEEIRPSLLPSNTLSRLNDLKRHSEERSLVMTEETTIGELVHSFTLLPPGVCGEAKAFLVATVLVPAERLNRMRAVSDGMADYQQLVVLKAPIKLSLISTLLIITLLIIFGAIWFGFFIARGLTGPINKLAAATRRVAEGELEFVIEKEADDEMGLLVVSFNKMTADLAASNRKLAETNAALAHSNLVSEQRRRHLEIILGNVTAGVIVINDRNEITTINRFAKELLKIDPADFLDRNYHDVLVKSHLLILKSFFQDLRQTGKPYIERSLRLTVRRGETYSLMVNITRLADEQGGALGYLIVFDNLTKLEQAQRLAAWQEVARRIAHEIKNPLTPIQLSAQRLRKRYLPKLAEEGEVFEQCTRTIVNQVDEIKRLVGEFSEFARLPRIKKQKANLEAVVEDSLVLYRSAHKQIKFHLQVEQPMPLFSFDPVQIHRVLINLLDNCVAVLVAGGEVVIRLRVNQSEGWGIMAVMDNGPGIADEMKLRLFEPYFSTKKAGTGLGLAIANTIVAEHGGVMKITDNLPQGACFQVELPLTQEMGEKE